MTIAITSTTLTTVESPPPITSGSFSNLQLVQQAPNLANPPAPYSSTFIPTLPKRYTTTTQTTSSPEFSFQQQTLPGSWQLPRHQHYLGVSSQLQF